jgi:hypothetical protein
MWCPFGEGGDLKLLNWDLVVGNCRWPLQLEGCGKSI